MGRSPAAGPWVPSDELIWGEDAVLPALWGPEETPLWMPGESLMIAGPSGVGKSTLAQELVAARIGLLDGVLGYPVEDDGGRVLYLSMDRAWQVKRMLRRVLDYPVTRKRLVVREGRIPVALTDERYTDWLLEQAQMVGATTVVLDSLKNVVLKPSDEGLANTYDSTRQTLVNARINLIEIHHTRKRGTEGRTQRGVQDDVYGSFSLVAGAGSVLVLTPDKEEGSVWLQQVKSLAGAYRPTKLTLDGEAGRFSLTAASETLDARITGMFLLPGLDGEKVRLHPRDLYPALFPKGATPNDETAVRKRLARLLATGELVKGSDGRYEMP